MIFSPSWILLENWRRERRHIYFRQLCLVYPDCCLRGTRGKTRDWKCNRSAILVLHPASISRRWRVPRKAARWRRVGVAKRRAKTRAEAGSVVVCVCLFPWTLIWSVPNDGDVESSRGIKARFPRAPEIMRASSRKSGNEARVLSTVLSLLHTSPKQFCAFPAGITLIVASSRMSNPSESFSSRMHFEIIFGNFFIMIVGKLMFIFYTDFINFFLIKIELILTSILYRL